MERGKVVHLVGEPDFPCWWWKLAKDGETVPIEILDVIIPTTVTAAEREYAAQLEFELAKLNA